jgi:hypothetical protein
MSRRTAASQTPERIIGPGGVIGVFTVPFRFVVSGSGEVVIEPVEVVEEECR